MVSRFARHGTGYRHRTAEGWLMQLIRSVGEWLAHPAYLYPDELSPHLLRDIGLSEGRIPGPRSRP